MQSIHVQIAEPTVLATARPQDGAGVMPVVRMDGARSTSTASAETWTTNSSFRSLLSRRKSKPLTCHGMLHIGGGLHDRIEVRPA